MPPQIRSQFCITRIILKMILKEQMQCLKLNRFAKIAEPEVLARIGEKVNWIERITCRPNDSVAADDAVLALEEDASCTMISLQLS